MKYHVYIGTYTRPAPYLANSKGEGLYVAEFDGDAGTLHLVQTVRGIENPSYLCVAPDGRAVHAVWEVLGWDMGLVSSYARDTSTGRLTFLGLQASGGALACYVTMDSRGRTALVANYLSGTVAALPVRSDGRLAEASSVVQQQGTGPVAGRQDGPHAHCIVVAPGDLLAFSADLGADTIFGYTLDAASARLEQRTQLRLPPGSGPRHLVFHPSGIYAYVVSELSSTMTALSFDRNAGSLGIIESYPMLPSDFVGESHCADVHAHPNGRFLYGSNRGHDSITAFEVDPSSGRLTLIGHFPSGGRTPRNFAIDPTGRHLLVANQDSDTIVIFPIHENGGLGEPVATCEVPTPNCLKFAPTPTV
jgi:6-phosphogluconolactonase